MKTETLLLIDNSIIDLIDRVSSFRDRGYKYVGYISVDSNYIAVIVREKFLEEIQKIFQQYRHNKESFNMDWSEQMGTLIKYLKGDTE